MPTQHRPYPALRAALVELLVEAQAKPGQAATCRLSNNLKVDLTASEQGLLLAISRSSSWPTDSDWRAILRHWPYPVEAVPEKHLAYGRRYLRAVLPDKKLTDLS